MLRYILKLFYNFFVSKRYSEFGINSRIKKPLSLINTKYMKIGKYVQINKNSRIEAVNKWNGIMYNPQIIIEDNVNIEQGLHLTCASKVIIHSNCLITPYVMISDINHIYNNISVGVIQQGIDVKDVEIGESSFIGCGAKIMPGVILGKHCVVGANAVVTKSFPDYCVIVGNPAKCIKKFDIMSESWKKTDQFGNFILGK